MHSEDAARQQLDESSVAIQQALDLIEKMARLKSMLMISSGSGRRYLEHAKPTLSQLKTAEQLILSELTENTSASKKTCKKTHLVQAMSLKGMA